MTTPGGVPNLPQGALTLDTLASKTQDMSVSGMRGRANERVSSIFGSSTGGDVTSDLSPLGVIAAIFSGFSSVVANADPADIQGPEDLPGLLLDFIESLPVIGELVDLLEAINGTYTGDDETLLTVQAIFAPIRAVVDAITTGPLADFLDLGGSFFTDLLGLLGSPTSVGSGSPVVDTSIRIPIISGLLDGLFGGFTNVAGVPANQTLVADAATGVSSSISGNAAGLAQLQAALSPGNPDADDFERTVSGNWTTTQWMVMEDGVGGDASLDGHDAVWTGDYTNDTEMVARRLVKQATTDNQTVSAVLDSAVGAITDGTAAMDLWLRMSAFTTYATRTGVRFRFWGDKTWQLHWFNAGTGTLLTSGTHSKSMSSGTFEFDAGQSLTTRRFVAKINSEPIMDFTESGTGSLVGANYRWRGIGLRSEFSLLGIGFVPAIQVNPGKLKQWTASG